MPFSAGGVWNARLYAGTGSAASVSATTDGRRALRPADHRKAVELLGERDRRLAAVTAAHGTAPFWTRKPGFACLVHMILEQQVSLASAQAAMSRLGERLGTVEPEGLLALDDATLRTIGFSRQKTRYTRALATAVRDGELRLRGLGRLDDDRVRERMTAIPGIGRWTADVYLLMALRRPDIWPTGDRALVVAAGEVLRRPTPDADQLERWGERWRPYRSVAARILWHHYLSTPRRRG